ncbi:hypothetical protein ABPG75_012288 [Micractinium tetrahymenae]
MLCRHALPAQNRPECSFASPARFLQARVRLCLRAHQPMQQLARGAARTACRQLRRMAAAKAPSRPATAVATAAPRLAAAHAATPAVPLTRLAAAPRSGSSLLASVRLQRAICVAARAQAAEAAAAAAAATSEQEQEQPAAAAAAASQEQQPEEPKKEYAVVNFFHLVDLERPWEIINASKQWLEGKEVRGRIYFSEQGVNAQFGGVREEAEGYAKWLSEQPLFEGLFYTVWPADEHMYPKLRLKYKPNLISLAGGMQDLPITRPEARAVPTPPAEWKRMLAEGQQTGRMPLVLDVRNSYEWDAGHFVGAERPLEENFNETPTEALPQKLPAYLETADPDQPVMIYCTGGIRCDVYGTYLKQKGFNNLYTLQGGIQNYMREEGLDHWNGSLFVFDGRMAIRYNKDEEAPLDAAAPCQVCGAEAVLPHMNCANIDCNKLFIACDGCKGKFRGCCCESCMDAPRLLRPAKTKGTYGNWSDYVSQSEGEDDDCLGEASQAIASGRGEGRISRRRKRQQAMKQRELAKRAVKVERRRQAKVVLAQLQSQMAEGAAPAANDEQAERLARLERLRELRQRLQQQQAASASA